MEHILRGLQRLQGKEVVPLCMQKFAVQVEQQLWITPTEVYDHSQISVVQPITVQMQQNIKFQHLLEYSTGCHNMVMQLVNYKMGINKGVIKQ